MPELGTCTRTADKSPGRQHVHVGEAMGPYSRVPAHYPHCGASATDALLGDGTWVGVAHGVGIPDRRCCFLVGGRVRPESAACLMTRLTARKILARRGC